MSEEYPPLKRITRRSEFSTIAKKGRRLRALDFDVRYVVSSLGYVRAGVIVPRHGRTAVKRNLLKRRLRELVRKILLPAMGSFDVVLRCRPSSYLRTFDELKQQIDRVRTELVRKGEGLGEP